MTNTKQRLFYSAILGALSCFYFLPFVANNIYWETHFNNNSDPHWIFGLTYVPIAAVVWTSWLFNYKLQLDENEYPFKLIFVSNFIGFVVVVFGAFALVYGVLHSSKPIDNFIEGSFIGLKVFLPLSLPGFLLTLILRPPQIGVRRRYFSFSLMVIKTQVCCLLLLPIIGLATHFFTWMRGDGF